MAAKRKVGRPRRVDDDDHDLPPPPDSVEKPPAWDCKPIAKQVQAVLDAVEAPPIDKETRLTLQRYLYRRNRYGAMFQGDDFGTDGRGHITLLLRTILESEGNQGALIEPIVSAVASCMRTIWIRKGVEWIAAFDRIPLIDILTKLRELDLFPEKELEQHYTTGIERRLWRIFGPDVVPEPVKVKPRRKLTRPSGISEQSWNDVLPSVRSPNRRPGADSRCGGWRRRFRQWQLVVIAISDIPQTRSRRTRSGASPRWRARGRPEADRDS